MQSPAFSLFQAAKDYGKAFPLLVSAKRKLWRAITSGPDDGKSKLNVLKTFPLYATYSADNYKDRAESTVLTIKDIIPLLTCLTRHFTRRPPIAIRAIHKFPSTSEEICAADELRELFDRNGSDKARHNYHKVYGPILKKKDLILGVLEIGLGTNNLDVLSNMGRQGKPGASLRAFRDFLPKADIYGADIDKRILFQEERISTYYVDQRKFNTLEALGKLIPGDLDLMIDDGLHSPDANLRTLLFGLTKIKAGGWIVIEDIMPCAIPVWEIICSLLPDNYVPRLFSAAGFPPEPGDYDDTSILFTVQRLR